jgi:PAS domain S-box-containing protein
MVARAIFRNRTLRRINRQRASQLQHELAERNKAQRQILASKQLFRAPVENSPDCIARYDREFRQIYANPAIQKLFGDRTGDALGKTPADQSPLYVPHIFMDHLRQVIETAAECTAEIPFRSPQGEMRWGHPRFVPEFDADGQVVSVLAIGRDIHEIKENEQRSRMLAENFPDVVVRVDRDTRYTFTLEGAMQDGCFDSYPALGRRPYGRGAGSSQA